MDEKKGLIDINKDELNYRAGLFWNKSIEMDKSADLEAIGVKNIEEKARLVNTYRSMSLALQFAAENEQLMAEWIGKQDFMRVKSM